MRCVYCGKKNIKRARYCSQCGAELSSVKGGAVLPAEGSGRNWLTAACCFAGLVLLFCAVFLILHHTNADKDDTEALATPKVTEVPAAPEPEEPTEKPTLPPLFTLRPTPKPTPTPRPTPLLTPMRTKVPEPTPTAVPLPEATDTPEPSPSVFEDGRDLEPVDALCGFILYGEAAYARKAFPPEFITYTANSYGFAVQLLGSEDAVIEYAGNLMVAGFKAKYGKITSIETELVSRDVLTQEELEELCSGLPGYGITEMPTEAHLLVIDLKITSDQGIFYERVVPHVLKINGTWYIDPEDIDM